MLRGVFQRWDSVFNSGHQNRKVRQAKLADGAAMCAAEIPSGQGPVGVISRRYRTATASAASPLGAAITRTRRHSHFVPCVDGSGLGKDFLSVADLDGAAMC